MQCALCPQHPPTPTTEGQDGAHRYVPRQGLWRKNQAIWGGARILWSIMTVIWRKMQGFGPEKKRDTHIAYNTVACFYSTVESRFFFLCQKLTLIKINIKHHRRGKFQ